MLQSLGSGATSNSYVDYENAGCLMVVGSDSSSNHPVVTVRFRRAVKRGATLIVVNPKWTELNYYADIWLRQFPGTDVALFNGLAYVLLDEGLADENFIRTRTEGFSEWAEAVREYPPSITSEITGVSEYDLIAAARAFGKPPFSGSCMIWGMGISQHSNGTANAHGVINPALYAAYGSAAFRDPNSIGDSTGLWRVNYTNSVDSSAGFRYIFRTLNVGDGTGGISLTIHTGAGYDNVTGVGSPNGSSFFNLP